MCMAEEEELGVHAYTRENTANGAMKNFEILHFSAGNLRGNLGLRTSLRSLFLAVSSGFWGVGFLNADVC